MGVVEIGGILSAPMIVLLFNICSIYILLRVLCVFAVN